MKLLFDENLSYKLCARIQDVCPNSKHVVELNLEAIDDGLIWQFAKEHEFIIVTQDSDFNDLLMLNGFPPAVILIKSGNAKVSEVESILRRNYIKIREFVDGKKQGIIEIR